MSNGSAARIASGLRGIVNRRPASARLNHKAVGYRRFLHILTSPHTGELLQENGDRLVTSSGRTYQIVNNVPVLVRQPEEMHVTPPPPSKISRNIDTYIVPEQFKRARSILHLGSGNVKCEDPRVISLDVLPLENVDIVAEAEVLPFASNSFDFVDSGAVFEHLYDPLAAIKEVKRVLAPGGVVRTDNSFLQPYHGFPGHYFAMTPQANETYLADDFSLIDSSIPESGTPLMSLSMVIERFLINLSRIQKEKVMKMTLENFLKKLKADLTSSNKLMEDFSEYEKRSMAATHVVTAKKPRDYEKKLAQLTQNPEEFEKWTRLKREYYTLRTEIMLRHHEIYAYRRFSRDINPRVKFDSIDFPSPVQEILQPLQVKDPLNLKELTQKMDELRSQERILTSIREAVITIFLTCKDRQEKTKRSKASS